MSKISKLLGVVIVASFGLVIVAAHGQTTGIAPQKLLDQQQAITDRALEDIRQGKGRALDAGEDVWSVFWRNCQMVWVKQRRTPIEVDSPGAPGGKTLIHTITSSKSDFEAQLPPLDPACLDVAPTQEQVDAAMAELNARSAKPGIPPPPNDRVPAKR